MTVAVVHVSNRFESGFLVAPEVVLGEWIPGPEYCIFNFIIK